MTKIRGVAKELSEHPEELMLIVGMLGCELIGVFLVILGFPDEFFVK
jgi:hypothetical protein